MNDEKRAPCPMGKLWTDRIYNMFAMLEMMKKLWNLAKGVTIENWDKIWLRSNLTPEET